MRKMKIGKLEALNFETEEALNQLRINLSFCGDNLRTIMITSSVPNEGKSFVSLHLWRMLANLGMKTLLIDADLRNSEMINSFQMSTEGKMMGIAYYLSGKCRIEDALYSTDIPNGYILPTSATVANPTILLESRKFSGVVEACSERFDYVIIDTPPLGSVADALNISRYCDGSILVVRSDAAPRKTVEESVRLLKRTETPILGVVLNRVDLRSRSNRYYSGYYRKRYYYKQGYGKGDLNLDNAQEKRGETQ